MMDMCVTVVESFEGGRFDDGVLGSFETDGL